MRSGREHWAWIRGWSWLRSDREHCASRVAVEQEEEERRVGEEQATDIKSNNPHLAGGEKATDYEQ